MSQRVLIVDDEQLLRTLMADVLFRGGFHTVGVENGIEALRVLQTDAAFALILSDVHMPRMDGLDLLRTVRQKYPHIPVLMTSVHSTSDQVRMLLQEGAAAYLPRPFTSRQLVDAANDAINNFSLRLIDPP